MLRSDLCDHSDVHIVVKGEIAVKVDDNMLTEETESALFSLCI